MNRSGISIPRRLPTSARAQASFQCSRRHLPCSPAAQTEHHTRVPYTCSTERLNQLRRSKSNKKAVLRGLRCARAAITGAPLRVPVFTGVPYGRAPSPACSSALPQPPPVCTAWEPSKCSTECFNQLRRPSPARKQHRADRAVLVQPYPAGIPCGRAPSPACSSALPQPPPVYIARVPPGSSA